MTFLFTDIEGSTGPWEREAEAMSTALAGHDAILRQAVQAHEGTIFATGGDGCAVAFPQAGNAIAAAGEAQRHLRTEDRPDDVGAVLVRMGLHTGEANERDGDYFDALGDQSRADTEMEIALRAARSTLLPLPCRWVLAALAELRLPRRDRTVRPHSGPPRGCRWPSDRAAGPGHHRRRPRAQRRHPPPDERLTKRTTGRRTTPLPPARHARAYCRSG